MPRAFLITNKRYKIGDAQLPEQNKRPQEDNGASSELQIEQSSAPSVQTPSPPSPASSPAPNPTEPATPPSAITFPGNAPHDLPFLQPLGSVDCSLSPSKGSIPSLSPCKPDSPAHSSNTLFNPLEMSPPPLIFSPIKRDPPLLPFPLPKWPTYNPLLGLTELSDIQRPLLPAHTHLAPRFMEPRLSNFVWGVNDLPMHGQVEEHHPCPDCGKAYSTSSNLARHRQTHRSMSDKKARKCPHCDKVYVSMPAYSMHVRTHSQGCQCPYCGKRFSRPWLLQGHIRTHTGEKPFSCHQCGKAFADKSNLRAHIQTHSTEKPYACGRCGKAFALKSYLYKHEESSCMRGQRIHGRATSFR